MMSSSVQPMAGATVGYMYQTNSGRKETMSVLSQTWTYNYDSAGRPLNVKQTQGDATAVTYAYNGVSDVSTMNYGNSWRNRYSYDQRRRVTGVYEDLNVAGTWGTQNATAYTLDPASNIIAQSRTNASNAVVMATNEVYDNADRLIEETGVAGAGWPSAMNYQNAYYYDKDGNRIKVGRGTVFSTYSVDPNDKLSSTTDGYTFSSYDGDGNPTAIQSPTNNMSLDYNQADELTELSAGQRVAKPTANSKLREVLKTGFGVDTFLYDGDGRRIQKNDSGGTTNYVYDGTDVIAEMNGSTTYRLPGVGEYNASTEQQLYQMPDQLGSTIGEVAETSSFSGQYNYDGYGLESDVSSRPGGSSNFRFGGKHGYLTDPDAGMILCGARYYLPILGRFLTQDPTGHGGGLNLYGYCGDNPLKGLDPSGLQAITVDSVTQNTNRMLAEMAEPSETETSAQRIQKGIQDLEEYADQLPGNRFKAPVRDGLQRLFQRNNGQNLRGFVHSFSRHAGDWFGRDVSTADYDAWSDLINSVTKSKSFGPSSLSGQPTIAFISRYQNAWVAVHYFTEGERAGEIASAFRVNAEQAAGIFRDIKSFMR